MTTPQELHTRLCKILNSSGEEIEVREDYEHGRVEVSMPQNTLSESLFDFEQVEQIIEGLLPCSASYILEVDRDGEQGRLRNPDGDSLNDPELLHFMHAIDNDSVDSMEPLVEEYGWRGLFERASNTIAALDRFDEDDNPIPEGRYEVRSEEDILDDVEDEIGFPIGRTMRRALSALIGELDDRYEKQ